MSELKHHGLTVGEGKGTLTLDLWQKPNPDAIPVLLLHGASANHETFMNPAGPVPAGRQSRCLMDWLRDEGFEPWLLDWRGNGRNEPGKLGELRDHLDFDAAATLDIPKALERIRRETGAERIGAVGHCMGAASLAQAIAKGSIDNDRHRLTNVVLLAIGLFYEPAWDSRLKAEDHALERAWQGGGLAIDPRVDHSTEALPWPAELEEIYQNWPVSMRQHAAPRSPMDDVCNRVSFMFGAPYLESNLLPEAHRGTFLGDQFGAIPLRMYLHAARNIRRGWAAEFNARIDDDALLAEDALGHFGKLDAITLLTGAENRIWHRDSIDRMHEWLERGRFKSRNFSKVILANYAHQDLLWGREAYKDVFPRIRAGLLPPAPALARGKERAGREEAAAVAVTKTREG